MKPKQVRLHFFSHVVLYFFSCCYFFFPIFKNGLCENVTCYNHEYNYNILKINYNYTLGQHSCLTRGENRMFAYGRKGKALSGSNLKYFVERIFLQRNS